MGQPCMTKEELFSHDRYGAFAEFLTVVEAKEKGVLPRGYWGNVPEKCECGAEMLVSRSLIHVMCCNPRCHVKLGYNLEKVYRNFGVVGIGPATCLEISKFCLERTQYHSHLEFLMLGRFEFPYSLYGVKGQDVEIANGKIQKEVMPFGVTVSRLGIPSWGSDALKHLGQYDDYMQWVDDVKSYNSWSRYFDFKLGVYDPMKRFYLEEYATDVLYACSTVFKRYVLRPSCEIPITLSGSLNVKGLRVTKAAYLELLNKMAPVQNGRKVVQFVNNAAVASNAYVISDEMHTKARVAKQREAVTGKKILYGSAEFLEYVKGVFEKMVGESNDG